MGSVRTFTQEHRPANPELFISYASGDLDHAAALHTRLAADGFRVWFDKLRLTPGCDWHKEIETGCEAARVILPLITPGWAKSEWTRYETYAHDAVIPVLVDGKAEDVMPPPLRRWNAVALDPLVADDTVWRALLSAIRAKLAEPAPERAPRIVDLPYPANPFFTGRDDDLVRIHEELHAAPVAALTQGRVRALAAMGGIGKTTLANEYARRYWRLYPQILWVDARAGLESGFALLFGKLFPGRSDAGIQQPDKAQLVLAELCGSAERLLILDNVEDAESVRPWLPRDPTTGCRTLITSRFAGWPEAEGIRAIQLDVLEPEPAREFLMVRTGRPAQGVEWTACDELARELGYLPLALEQAAAFIAAPGGEVDFTGYLRLDREAAAELLACGALGSTKYPDPVITTWQATVAKLSPESRGVLRLCAWYADTPIPRALVMQGAEEVLALARSFGPAVPLSGPAAVELRMRDALKGLARYSMILGTTDTTFRVHGLVQTVERVRADADGTAAEARDRALTRLTDLFPNAHNDPARWPLCRLLLPHQQVLLTNPFSDRAAYQIAYLENSVGNFLRASGDAAGALPVSRRALEISERVLGKGHPETLTCVNDLAACLLELGDAAEALPVFRRALEISERVCVCVCSAKSIPKTLTSVNNLAACMRALGDVAGALPVFRRVLDSSERVLGKEHPKTLIRVSNLAGCMKALGDAAGALPLHRRALDGSERVVLGKEHQCEQSGRMHTGARGCGGGFASLSARARQQRAHPPPRQGASRYAHQCEQSGPMHAGAGECGGSFASPPTRARQQRAHPPRQRASQNAPQRGESRPMYAGAGGCGGSFASPPTRARQQRARSPPFLGKEHPNNTLTSVNNLAECMRALGDAAGALPLYRGARSTAASAYDIWF
jgi:tetratricopeptide (TPR) repeat protein